MRRLLTLFFMATVVIGCSDDKSGVDRDQGTTSDLDAGLDLVQEDMSCAPGTPGGFQVELATGEEWLRSVRLDGRDMIQSGNGTRQGYADFLRFGDTYPVGTTHPAANADPGLLSVDTITVEEDGPLRAVVVLDGMTQSEEPTRIQMRIKFFAGKNWMQVYHTVEFRHADPRIAKLQGLGIDLPLAMDAESAVVRVGAGAGPLAMDISPLSTLHQGSIGQYRVQTATEHGLRTDASGRRSRGWIDVADGQGGVTVVMRDMWKDAPKQLTYRRGTSTLSAGLWSTSGPVMDARRYSNYPHWAQGESAGRNNDWVENTFYPGRPLLGLTRTHELVLYFHSGTSMEDLDALAADVQSPPLVYAGYENYREAGVTFAMPDYQQFPFMTQDLDHFLNFWLFHQELHHWFGWWDYGDIQHRFRSGGYGNFVDPDHLKDLLSQSGDRSFSSQFTETDFRSQQDWHFDNGRWGWTNTEGLPGHHFQAEYMRTGRRDVFFAGEALARHSRDIVTRHYGPRFGRGTRHGVQHFSDGNHEERQTVFSEIRFHHYFTGEQRTRDVMYRLAQESYSQGRVRRNVEHSARLYGLFTYWELTGSQAAGNLIRDYVHGLIVAAGISTDGELRFVDGGVEVVDPNRGVNGAGMFFHTFGALHGLLEYHQVTADAELRAALIRMGEAIIGGGDPRMINVAKIVGFSAQHGSSMAQDFLDNWITSSGGFNYSFRMVSAHPARYSGDLARMYGNQPIVFFVKNAMAQVMMGLGQEPQLSDQRIETLESDFILSDEDLERLDQADRRGFRDKPRLRWQHEYDDPELLPYFAPWRPETR